MAASLLLRLSAAAVAARCGAALFVMPWLCLERCGDSSADIAAQLAQLRKLAKAAAKAKALIVTPAKPRKKAGPPPAHVHESRL